MPPGPATDVFAILAERKRKRKPREQTTAELSREVSELEQIRRATGAAEIPSATRGFFARSLDVLSGFNYAIAGAVDELGQGRGIGAASGRALRELLSSAQSLPFVRSFTPEIQAEKEAFGKVLADMGVGTTTLLDVFPGLEGTFLEKTAKYLNTRGTIGLALDILADPTTYVTFGLGKSVPMSSRLGVRQLTKRGQRSYVQFQKAAREAGATGDDVFERAAESLISRADPRDFDRGGMKFAGFVVPGTPGLGARFGGALITAANRVPGGARILASADEFRRGVQASVRELFNPFSFRELPPQMREVAERISRKAINTDAVLKLRYSTRVRQSPWFQYIKANPLRERAILEAMDNPAKLASLSADERKAWEGFQEFMRELGERGVSVGFLDAKQIARPSYLHHFYDNDPEEFSEVWTAVFGRRPSVAGKHDLPRRWATMEEAREVSELANKISRAARAQGIATPVYPVLRPNYDLEAGLLKYIDWHVDKEVRQILAADMKATFGRPIRETFGVDAVYEISKDVVEHGGKTWTKIEDFFRKHPTIGQQEIDKGVTAWDKFKKGARQILFELDKPGQRQFFLRAFRSIRSPWQYADIVRSFGKRYGDLFPRPKLDLDGQLEDTLKVFGESARYVTRGGNELWGEGSFLIPRLIADHVENLGARVINTSDHSALKKMIAGWDWGNNIFKTYVYPFWPSSAFRDLYSNVFLSGLRIGLHAIDPRLARHSVGILAGRKGSVRTKAGLVYSYDELRDMGRRMGVEVTPEQWAQFTGDGYRFLSKRKLTTRALKLRASFDNATRYGLFVQNVIDGLNPTDAASEVARFLFNYNELSPIHRELVLRLVPFATFTVKNIKLQAEILRRSPGMAINQLKPFRGQTEDEDYLAKWDAQALRLRMDKDGKTVRMVTGIDLPFRNLDVLWDGTWTGTGRKWMGMLSPFIKVPLEVWTGTELFSGRKLTRMPHQPVGALLDKLGDRVPKGFNDWIGYKKEIDPAGRPSYSFDGARFHLVFRGWILSRILTTSDRVWRNYLKDRRIAGSWLDFLTGIRVRDLNIDEQQRKLLEQRRRELIEVLERRGTIRTFPVYSKAG